MVDFEDFTNDLLDETEWYERSDFRYPSSRAYALDIVPGESYCAAWVERTGNVIAKMFVNGNELPVPDDVLIPFTNILTGHTHA